MLRAVEKLRDEAIRNGNGNWDNGFDILWAYIAVRLNDTDEFEPDRLKKIETVLNRLKDFEALYLEDDYYDFLGDCVVDYNNHYGSQPHEYNPQLFRLDCHALEHRVGDHDEIRIELIEEV